MSLGFFLGTDTKYKQHGLPAVAFFQAPPASVGAGLLANAVYRSNLQCLTQPVRQQAGSYRYVALV